MPSIEDSFVEPKRQTRRVFGLLLALLTFQLGILALVLAFYDGPPPDDGDMIPPVSSTLSKGAPDPLAVFLRTLQIRPANSDPVDLYPTLPEEIRYGIPDKSPEMWEFVKSSEGGLEAVETLVSSDRTTWQWPAPKATSTTRVDTYSLHRVYYLGEALRMKAYVLAHTGNRAECRHNWHLLLQYSDGLAEAKGAYDQWDLPSTLINRSLSDLQDLITQSDLTPQDLREWLALLSDENLPSRESIGAVLRDGYLDFKMKMTSPNDFFSYELDGLRSEATLGFNSLRYNRLIKRNQTLTLRLSWERKLLERMSRGTPEFFCTASDMHRHWEEQMSSLYGPRNLIHSNLAGAMLAHRIYTPVLHALVWHGLDLTRFEIAKTMLALRIYELERGHLPEDLADLVPRYLPALPLDLFDGGPLKWLPEKRVLYSVDTDGIDEKGWVGTEGIGSGTDFGCYYWWSEPARLQRTAAIYSGARTRR